MTDTKEKMIKLLDELKKLAVKNRGEFKSEEIPLILSRIKQLEAVIKD